MTDYHALLTGEVIPALGCTEPVAVAYAAAWAARTLARPIERISVLASCNILKNAMGVGIPGTDMAGLPIAAALGALGGESEAGLEVLSGCGAKECVRAKAFVAEGRVTVGQKQTSEALYVEVCVWGDGHSAAAVIQRRHTLLTEVRLDDSVVLQSELEAQGEAGKGPDISVGGIWDYITQAPEEEFSFLMEGVAMNLRAAEEGLKGGYGMAVGYSIAKSCRHGEVFDSSIGSRAVATTAAACDARMAGATVPVMSVAGSGNQGLVCTVPVAIFAQSLKVKNEMMLRALALADLITIHIKHGIGRLSALCGCGIAAAVGASCGITYLLGGELAQIRFCIQNMIANITGMVCDGAKSGCAVKVATAVSAAVQCAVLASDNIQAQAIDGIVEQDVEKSIANLGIIGREGMAAADQVILDMMVKKAP